MPVFVPSLVLALPATSVVRYPFISSERQQVSSLGVVLEHWGSVDSEEGADCLSHPRGFLEHPGLPSCWGQVKAWPEVVWLQLNEKRYWKQHISLLRVRRVMGFCFRVGFFGLVFCCELFYAFILKSRFSPPPHPKKKKKRKETFFN